MMIRLLFLALLIALFNFKGAVAQIQDAPIEAVPITHFDLNDNSTVRFGQFEFVGGLVLTSPNENFGALSGLRISDEDRMTAVADTGFWFRGTIERDQTSKPVGLSNGQIAPVLNSSGTPFQNKWSSDIEGITFDGDDIFLSTEMNMRVLQFSGPGDAFKRSSNRITESFDKWPISINFSFEAIATLPKSHAHHPGLLIIAERGSLGRNQTSGFILKDGKALPLSVAQDDGFSITDADFLPGGDLLVLERRYTPAHGPSMRIRKISGKSVQPDAVLQGVVVLNANNKQVIDNMEGLSVFTDGNGATRIGLVSDNNHWLMQRSIYLEFKLVR